MTGRGTPSGPSGAPKPEGHQWVAMFLFDGDNAAYTFEDVQLLSYVPRTSDPAVAFDGLVEQERDELQREPENPDVARITLELYDEESAYGLAIKDAVNQKPDPIWSYAQTFGTGEESKPFEVATEEFRRAVNSCSPPSV